MTLVGRKAGVTGVVNASTNYGTRIFTDVSPTIDITDARELEELLAFPTLQIAGGGGTAVTFPVIEQVWIQDGKPTRANPVGGGTLPAQIAGADSTGVITDRALGGEPLGLTGGFRAEVCPPPNLGVFANSDRAINNTGVPRTYFARHAPVLKRTTSFIHFAVKVASAADDGVCIAGYDLITGARLWSTGRVTGLLNSTGQKRIALEVPHDPAVPIVVAASFESANTTGATVFGRSIGAADTVDIFVPNGLTPSWATGKLIGSADGISQPLPSTIPAVMPNSVNTVPLIIFSEV